MKISNGIPLILVLSASSLTCAQSPDPRNMDMKGMDMGGKPQSQESKEAIHRMNAVVKAVDVAKGRVTLAHEPVESLNWPAMTMRFSVREKKLFEDLAVGKKVSVEFVEQGSDYVVMDVK